MEVNAVSLSLVIALIVNVAVNALQFCRLKKAYKKMEEMRNAHRW